jgi:mycothione reductase
MTTQHYDLVIVGAGSGNSLINDETGKWRIAVVDSDRFGGTCLNRGCVPSKMLVHTADVALSVRRSDHFDLRASWHGADWPAIRDRVFSRIDPIHDNAVKSRREDGIHVYLDDASFVGAKQLQVGGDVLTADRFVLAAGARPVIPPFPGLGDVDYFTSDTVMRIATLPKTMAVIGGGFIAAEMSHIFGSLGTTVTIVSRGNHLLARHDHDIRNQFTKNYMSRFDLRLESVVAHVEPTDAGVRLHLTTPSGKQSLEVEALLLATGRTPNSDRLDVAATGVKVDKHGHVHTDNTCLTNVPGIWALGDITNHFQLKHLANAEARIVRHNLMHPNAPKHASFPIVPSAVFADPQVASVGATEEQLRTQGRDYVAAIRHYRDTAYGWALEDTNSFVKILADPTTRLVLGAHLIGPQASILIQPLVQAMCLANTVDQVASEVIYIHPALSEVIEQALLAL